MEVAWRIGRLALGVGLIAAFTGSSVFGQEETELRLTVRRIFGYRAGDQIQGRFSLEVEGPAELVQVTFLIDGQTMVQDSEPPFEHGFRTREYSVGNHRLMATGRLEGGREVQSAERTFVFVTAEASWAAVGRIVAPLLGVVFGLIALAAVAPALLIRRRGFHLGEYGSAGGAVCPSCQLPFSRSFWSPNLIRGKVGRCPHCGKWSVVGRAPTKALEEAELRFRAAGRPQFEMGPDRDRRLIDESRYEP